MGELIIRKKNDSHEKADNKNGTLVKSDKHYLLELLLILIHIKIELSIHWTSQIKYGHTKLNVKLLTGNNFGNCHWMTVSMYFI